MAEPAPPIRRNTILLAASLAANSAMLQLSAAVATLTVGLVVGVKGLVGLGPAIVLGTGALSALPAGRAMDRFGRVPVLATGFALGSAGCALTALAAAAVPARAAWDNVFQVCCATCGTQATANFVAADPCCPPPPPQQVCTTRYVQRTYYQPVTCYQTRTYYEPVTTNYTSYYYEPVTEYRYTTYYDPCTGCPQRVCTPCTSYRLRSKCNSVTNYVARISYRPVTTMRQSCYLEAVPVNPCCPAARVRPPGITH